MNIVDEITARRIKLEQANIKPSFIYLGYEQVIHLKKYLADAFSFEYTKVNKKAFIFFDDLEIIEVDRTSHLNVG